MRLSTINQTCGNACSRKLVATSFLSIRIGKKKLQSDGMNEELSRARQGRNDRDKEKWDGPNLVGAVSALQWTLKSTTLATKTLNPRQKNPIIAQRRRWEGDGGQERGGRQAEAQARLGDPPLS